MDDLFELAHAPDMETAYVHMCQHGLMSEDSEGVGFVKKPTKVITNLPSIAESVEAKCDGSHRHVWLTNGTLKPSDAARYTPEFCRAILRGVQVHLRYVEEVQALG